ncbi:hypothetical protein E8E13_010206 [Curvularia kusanoi]|uniref:AB hydrolase-1 domain-containing protein n=1 Tax=Curvularia kusanoi TaxID=90978 RepID=A0A9P4TGR9_CURKU|nr:hypothetical protein E8E13_010206 [Curvularia kusanoi]
MATPSSDIMAQTASDAMLPHQSLNEDGKATILFIHGACVDSNDWDLVVPYMHNYHLLLPDSPGHGRSSHLRFSIKSSAQQIAYLIRTKAITGRAHVVGHSLGAKIAIRLAIDFPDIVLSTFISDYSDMPVSSAPILPYFFWLMNRVENAVPRPAIRWLMDGTDLRPLSSTSLSLCKDIASPEKFELTPWAAKTLIIVAGKGGLIPSSDSADAARRLLKVGKEGNAKTVAFVHPAMRHPWNRQDPVLWAGTVIAWIEEEDLPSEFVSL